MKRASLLFLQIAGSICFWLVVVAAVNAFTVPPQPSAVDAAQAFAQQTGEWTKVKGWNYKFQLLSKYYDARDDVQHMQWCVTAARASKKAFYQMEILNGFDTQAMRMNDSIVIARSEQPCEGVRPGRFRTPKKGGQQ